MRTLILASALLLAGCGFQPLYAPGPVGAPVLGSISVTQIEGKTGHELKTALDRLFSPERGTTEPKTLEIKLIENLAGVGYRIDDTASRVDMDVRATYVLRDPAGKELAKGELRTLAPYDVPASAYGEITAQNDARERAAEDLAERIRIDLALKLNRKQAEAALELKNKTASAR
jgi:LPS-assembly lipoprotein